MPLYEYKCENCGLEFEEITSYEKRDLIKCKICNGNTIRKISTFGINIDINPKKDTVYTSKEIDKVVGKESEKKWQSYNEKWKERYKKRQEKRWKGKVPEIINIPKDSDGKYSPIMHLGNKKEIELRKEYSEALKEHRKERMKKGISQFDGPGAILVE
jgi:putative FmdB family regulatory protein